MVRDVVEELVKTATVQGTENTKYIYIPKDMWRSLGLSKGDKVLLMLVKTSKRKFIMLFKYDDVRDILKEQLFSDVKNILGRVLEDIGGS